MKKLIFSRKFCSACLIVADQVYGPKGTWAYETYSFINEQYFAGRLPWPHILWGLTAHGGCVAWSNTVSDKSRPPLITLHPSLLHATEKKNPWGIPGDWLGPALIFDTLLHECIHVHINYNLGGHKGRTSHDCKPWVRQVNRLASLMDFQGIRVGTTKLKRVPDRNAPRTVRGKYQTKVVRICEGNVPFAVGAGFPQSLRCHLETASDYYEHNKLPPEAPKLKRGRSSTS